jgi:hypothetical protein
MFQSDFKTFYPDVRCSQGEGESGPSDEELQGMKFLRRKIQATETVREEGRVTHREIEITVEREWISIPSENHRNGGMQAAEMSALELPPTTKQE